MSDALSALTVTGALHLPDMIDITGLKCLDAFCNTVPVGRAGVRLKRLPMAAIPPRLRDLLTGLSDPQVRPVRAILFDKTGDANWSLGWHQDRTIAVRGRVDVPDFRHWTIKQGIAHVEPPFTLSATMLTARVHLDDVDADNAPLVIAAGSHRLGRIDDDRAATTGAKLPSLECHARRGDVWLYATPIIHRSGAAALPGRRRVIQIDFAAATLPGGLEWLDVDLFDPQCAA